MIDRHDILRTGVHWEGLPEPVQMVQRRATLPVEELALDAGAGSVAEQLLRMRDPRRHRMDVRQAPLLHASIAADPGNERWLLLLRLHHLAGDHTTLEGIQREVHAIVHGQEQLLAAPLPFRNLVAQARLGVSEQEHEAFFRKMLGDIEEPTAPFGLLGARGDGSEIREAVLPVEGQLARRLRRQARRVGISAASVFHLAWGQVLARTSGREDVVFGTVLFGRMQGGEGTDRVLGLFINTLPLRLELGGQGIEERLRHTHALLTQLLHHEHAPLALAQRCSSVPAPQPSFSHVSACATGAHSVGEAFRIIRDGTCDIMLAGGSEAPIQALGVGAFSAARTLSTRNDSPKKASRPFEKNRDGFVLAEGACVLVLEELEHARTRGGRIYAEILGYGLSNDAHHIVEPAPNGTGAQRCMRAALIDAGIAKEEVDYINAHGTATVLNDIAESRAIEGVFNDHARKLQVSSTKSMMGA